MYPHERSLVKKLADRPFVIIGVNSDKSRDEVRKALEQEHLTWRSFWDGGGVRGPIPTRWNVRAWPTLYLVDPRGVIRYKGVESDRGLDAAIDRLLAEVAGATPAAKN